MKKTMKIMLVAVMVLMMVASISNVVFAYQDPGTFEITGTGSALSDHVGKVMGSILGVVQVVAISVAVIMLIVLGIKYISAAPGEKADIKKGAMIYVVGAALLFGASGIMQIIKTFAQSSLNGTPS